MKKNILTALFALCCTIGFAQVSFQVKAGLNLSSYIGCLLYTSDAADEL